MSGTRDASGCQMLRKLSEQVSDCYARASECARKAENAFTDDMRQDFLRLEQSWLTLARSFEFAERLVDFSKENDHNRRKLAEVIERVFNERAGQAADTISSKSSH